MMILVTRIMILCKVFSNWGLLSAFLSRGFPFSQHFSTCQYFLNPVLDHDNLLITGSSWRSVYITAPVLLTPVSWFLLWAVATHTAAREATLRLRKIMHWICHRHVSLQSEKCMCENFCSEQWIASSFWINILFDRSNEKEHEHFTGHLKDTILRYVSQHLLLTLWIYNIIDF